jgi:uncharacterized caspase-like protein
MQHSFFAIQMVAFCLALHGAGFDAHAAQPAGGDRNLMVSAVAAPSPSTPAVAGRRVALVIGNGNYKDAPLGNPVNDARAIAQALKESGFTVIARENTDQKGMHAALREFGDKLRNGGVGLFYYAGHGMQIKGRNYLIPVGSTIEREDEVAYAAVDAQAVLDKMEAAGNATNIMILDACRNNPFARSFRSGQAGLAPMDAPVGTLVAFATSPGSVASDGGGQNGLYTQHLLTAMRQPGAKVEDVFKQVRAHVRRDSQGKQIPWEATSLEGDFYFQGGKPTSSVARDTTTNRYGYTVGDRWRFQTIDRQKGEVVSNWGLSVDYIEADGSMLLNRGTTRLDPAGRIKYVKNADGRERTYPTTNLRWFPDMKKGEQRAISFAIEDRRASGTTYHVDHQAQMRVFDFEKIKTPAGEFQAQRIELKGSYKSVRDDGKTGEGTFFNRYWYAPSLRYYVVAEYENTDWNGKQERSVRDELTSFEVVNPPAAQR